MVTQNDHLQGTITLESIFWRDRPRIEVGIDSKLLWSGDLAMTKTIEIDLILVRGHHDLWVKFLNKTDDDCVPEQQLDKAVKITNVDFFGIHDQRILYRSLYYPQYPELYQKTCTQQGIALQPEIHANYLGWNGIWRLNFRTPIFVWLHQILDFGWIYD
jgi:hypothetical protein